MSSFIWDDQDPLILYSPGWQRGGLATEYNSTTTFTDSGGATATITFYGVRIGVYGTLGSSNSNKTAPQSQYQLDDTKPLLFQPTLGPISQRSQRFYQSPELAEERHKLVVTNLINGSSGLFLDYFVIFTGEPASSSPISATAVPATTTKAEISSRDISIISAAVGGAATAVLVILGFIYFWRRRKRKLVHEQNMSMVQSAWMDSPDATNWSPAYPFHSRPNVVPSSSALTPINSAIGPSKIFGNNSSTPSSPDVERSPTDDPYLPAPPEYKP